MNVAYVDMLGGAAGDMLLGAWIDAGVDPVDLEAALRTVVPNGWTMTCRRVDRMGIAATAVEIVVPGDGERHNHRSLSDVLAQVERSGLSHRQIARASAVFRRIAEAEAHVHGVGLADVVFHEVGRTDAILDVAGTCIALDLLDVGEFCCSAFPVGRGLIDMHHGIYPNPGPATLELLRGFPLRSTEVVGELVTVTGAAILATLAASAPFPEMTPDRIGYGAGRNQFSIPNVVRIVVGRKVSSQPATDVVVIESNIDDMSPQHYELALERIFAAGALDAWLTPIVMKKGRPAIVLAALALPQAESDVAAAILRETTTIGVRVRTERRHVLEREIVSMETPLGSIRAKRVELNGAVRWQPEYDDAVRVAREQNLPLTEVARIMSRACDMRERQ